MSEQNAARTAQRKDATYAATEQVRRQLEMEKQDMGSPEKKDDISSGIMSASSEVQEHFKIKVITEEELQEAFQKRGLVGSSKESLFENAFIVKEVGWLRNFFPHEKSLSEQVEAVRDALAKAKVGFGRQRGGAKIEGDLVNKVKQSLTDWLKMPQDFIFDTNTVISDCAKHLSELEEPTLFALAASATLGAQERGNLASWRLGLVGHRRVAVARFGPLGQHVMEQ